MIIVSNKNKQQQQIQSEKKSHEDTEMISWMKLERHVQILQCTDIPSLATVCVFKSKYEVANINIVQNCRYCCCRQTFSSGYTFVLYTFEWNKTRTNHFKVSKVWRTDKQIIWFSFSLCVWNINSSKQYKVSSVFAFFCWYDKTI